MKPLFYSDYLEGAHPEILKALTLTNMEQSPGYGEDTHCKEAANLVRKACSLPEADVHFLVGGTQTNATVIASVLRPHQGVICAETGHIGVHETGAIEHSGHKVLPLPAVDGKISARQIADAVDAHWADGCREHTVQPGMVYISFPTELGTIYSKSELQEISAACAGRNIPLYIDGARLGYGLTSPECDITLPELAALADVFYIGGTKQGALFGEAVVIRNEALKRDFRYFIKQNGGMLAKGRLLGIQYEVLFNTSYWTFDGGSAPVTSPGSLRSQTASGQYSEGQGGLEGYAPVTSPGSLRSQTASGQYSEGQGGLEGYAPPMNDSKPGLPGSAPVTPPGELRSQDSEALYFQIARKANEQAERIRKRARELGIRLFGSSPTNQIFLIMEDSCLPALDAQIGFEFWQRYDAANSVIRVCTSWATSDSAVETLLESLESIHTSNQ